MFLAESQEDVQYIIHTIVRCLRNVDADVRMAAIEGVSKLALAEQGMC